MIDSRCGLHCTDCPYKESHGCGGCIETGGHPFHGECPVALCCREKECAHCGECPAFPCRLLMEYSCDPEHGDHPAGERILQCKEWGQQKPDVQIGHTIYVLNSAHAVSLYQEAFGLELGYHVKNADGSFFHSELCEKGREILSVVQTQEEHPTNNLVCLGMTLKNEQAVRRAFFLLSQDGDVKRPLGSLPWSPCCAEVIDRFGVWWYITAPQHRPNEFFPPEDI